MSGALSVNFLRQKRRKILQRLRRKIFASLSVIQDVYWSGKNGETETTSFWSARLVKAFKVAVISGMYFTV